MTSHDFPESDWKTFRELRELALQRFCKQTLDELEPIRLDESRSYHERYLDIVHLLLDRNARLAQAFDDVRRSRMIAQLAAIHAYGLLEPEELARFTSETRSSIEEVARAIMW
jgi:hypothetical protein